jgi:multicomponent Na+:H+ antiporter subunit E
MVLFKNMVFAFPLMGLWLALSNELTLESGVIGYLLGLAVLFAVGDDFAVTPQKLPGQLVNLVIYGLALFKDILLSSIDVARRVLDPTCPIDPEIVPVSTQDDENNSLIAGLSIHGITVTPGEMVVGYDEDEGVMYVHCLNGEASKPTLDPEQSRRLARIKRIMGHD